MTRLKVVLLLIVAACNAGCSARDEMGQVHGTVRFGDQPLAGVLVTFIPEKSSGRTIRSMGQTDEQGRYQLRAENQADGAIVGSHRVIVEDLAIYSAERDADGTVLRTPPVRFSPLFTDPLQSPLQVDVRPGEQSADLDVTNSP